MKEYAIIGGSTGIGQAAVAALAAAGHQVFATYFQTEDPPQHAHVSYHRLDVREEELDFSFMPETLDGLVFCPGSINLKPFMRLKPKAFAEDYELQVIGAIKCIQGLLSRLKVSTGASIVLFSTVAVQMGFNFHAQVAASKGAIEGLTRSLAAEFAPHIRVNCIAPSLTDTPLASKLLKTEEKKQANADRHPLKKIGQPEDLASLVQFLLTEQSAWMTGQVLHLDGGMSSVKG